jgi:ribosomal protein S18 acetylase RimI-like enzyme
MTTSLFCNTALAAAIDRAEARLCAEFAQLVARRAPDAGVTVVPVAGGLAIFAGPGAPMNKVIGLGLGDALDDAALTRLESEWASRREPVRVELSSLDDGAVARLLTARGYRLLGFENVLGRRIDESDVAVGSANAFDIERVDNDEVETWISITIAAFAHPDEGPLPTEAPPQNTLAGIFRDMSLVSGLTCYLARVDGVVAGAASLRIDGRLAQFTGAATLPAFRRRGIQTALTRHRLAAAHAAGCDLAVVTTQPGSKSQENSQRRGFELLYARAILVK